jgi:hypothetical protein
VQASRTMTTLWSHPSLSRLSLRTQASTSNTTSGQASAPVLTFAARAGSPDMRGLSC